MMHSKICILGGTGFIGSHLASLLTSLGYQVRILTRTREKHRSVLALPRVELIEADIHIPQVLTDQFTDIDAVINLVGILNEKKNDGSGFRHAHVELARKLIQSCEDTGVQRLLHMSALNADAQQGPSFYLKTKGEAEDLVHAAASEHFHVTSFRPSVVFGPGDSFFNRFAGLLRIAPLFFPLACPDSRFAPVFVGNVAAAFAEALNNEHTYGRRYDLCGPEVYTLKQLVEYTAKSLGVHRTVIGLPPLLSRLQAQILERVPGKPFSRDNYLSLQVDSICHDNGLEQLGIHSSTIDAVVPAYLTDRGSNSD